MGHLLRILWYLNKVVIIILTFSKSPCRQNWRTRDDFPSNNSNEEIIEQIPGSSISRLLRLQHGYSKTLQQTMQLMI